MSLGSAAVAVAMAAVVVGPALAAMAAETGTLPAEPPEQLEARVAWWRQARFGMFVHWDPSSLKGTEISWSRIGGRRDSPPLPLVPTIPLEEYDNLYQQFNPRKFNATEWIRIAKAAGMRYLVFTVKHHAGFCMFDSKLTDYKITNSPFQRDVTAELAKAAHKAGIHLGFYYSPPDWHHPDCFTEHHDRYIEYMRGQVRELLTNYGPVDILWFDSDGGPNAPETWGTAKLMPMIRQLQPQILLTKRCGGIGDYDTPEQRVGAFQQTPWESCMTICKQWSWKPNDDLKSLAQCLQTLIACAGGDGNLLFNVGPMPTGEIEPRQVARLKEMGAWLAKYGPSIYGTRGGPFKPADGVYSTYSGKTVYIHVTKWTGDTIKLPPIPRQIVRHKVLTGGTAQVQQNDTGINIAVPPQSRQEIDTIIRLELDGPAAEIAPR